MHLCRGLPRPRQIRSCRRGRLHCSSANLFDGIPDIFNLVCADQRAHTHTFYADGSPTGVLSSRALSASMTASTWFLRHDGPADGGTFLAGLDRDFLRNTLDEQVKFRCSRSGIGAQDGAIQ